MNDRLLMLLAGRLGSSERRPLTAAQLKQLEGQLPDLPDADIGIFLNSAGVSGGCSADIMSAVSTLVRDTELLDTYLERAKRFGIGYLTMYSDKFPIRLKERPGSCSPCLWYKGNLDFLTGPCLALVGNRELRPGSMDFAREVGRQAAVQGFVLVSGNARGADAAAQEACIAAGGRVISVLADRLEDRKIHDRMLFISEDDYDAPFSAYRALKRNHLIHALGECVFVAQCSQPQGGTWKGSVENLRSSWSPVFVYDQSGSTSKLFRAGAHAVSMEELSDIRYLIAQAGERYIQQSFAVDF